MAIILNGVDGGYNTIQEAIDAASENDTITLETGTYSGNFNVNKNGLTIAAAEGAVVVIEGTFKTDNGITGSVAEFMETTTPANTGSGAGITVSADSVTLSNIKIDSFYTGIDIGNGVDGLTVEAVIIEDTRNGIRKGSGAAVTDLTITGGEIRDSFIGIYFAKDGASGLTSPTRASTPRPCRMR
jgi:pectin methylesterase-like acyl-CoA thioesterase